MRFTKLVLPAAVAVSLLALGCDRNPAPPATSDTSAAPAPHHEHKPPHGGCLVELGEEFLHLELILDAKEGKLTGYALDGEAENAVRLKQEQIVVKIQSITGVPANETTSDLPLFVSLKAVPSSLSGETAGDTSEFAAQSDNLKGATHFRGEIQSIVIKGQEFKNVTFDFPEGNDQHAK